MSCFVIRETSALNGCQLGKLEQAKFVYVLCLDEVFVCYSVAAIKVCNDHRFIDDVFDGDRSVIDEALREGRYRDTWLVGHFIQVVLDDFTTILVSGRSHINLAVKAARAQECRVKGVRNVGRADS